MFYSVPAMIVGLILHNLYTMQVWNAFGRRKPGRTSFLAFVVMLGDFFVFYNLFLAYGSDIGPAVSLSYVVVTYASTYLCTKFYLKEKAEEKMEHAKI